MKKKNSKLFKTLLIIFLIVIVTMSSLVLINKKYNLPNCFIKDGILFIDRFISISFSNNKLEKETEKLRKENEKLKISKQENDELKTEIKKLKDILELKSLLSDKEIIYASVINRNLDYWNETLNIDKGSNEGISNNMAVVNNGYLIGITSNVSEYNSVVSLFTNSKLPISISVKIKINNEYVYGILSNYKDGYYEIMGIVENIDIPKEAIVVTSGLSNSIPSGIVIGSVDSIVTDNFDLSKIVKVKPGTNFDDIGYVSVIKGDI